MPMYIEDISRGPSEVDAMDSIREVVDFRKLELYAAFDIEKEEGGAPYLRRYVDALRPNIGRRVVYARNTFFQCKRCNT